MTIEHTTDLLFRYRICGDDPYIIERKLNKPHARWKSYRYYPTPDEAKQALLAMQGDTDEDETE